ncbi:hypothetical protein [Roseobacter sp. CCS2]|uniref:hypothetical protein n=1 Tax=Roseobacter sp. CCS2 TaxID=391593 RepID=UPI0000F3E362|nr:hypothetical protein [Roseobacter sp. CCS2]EBA11943.1 hypothetical protein RCCS2_11639 [Roseobacter sp. CCS2]
MPAKSILATIVAFVFATGVAAEAPQPVTLDPIEHTDAQLVIIAADGTAQTYTPATLEALPTYRVRTTTPWRDEPVDFDGVLLSDLLEANGLHLTDEINVIAENDFSTTIPRALWDTVPVLVATRVDGRAHTRRERGPIQFIIDKGSYTASPVVSERHLVWMAARIKVE